MSQTIKIYQGEDEVPVVDLTDVLSPVHVIFEEVEAGGRAYNGESSLSSFPMRDERGESGSGASLPAGLDVVSLSAGSRVEWLVNGHRLFRGRVGPKDYSRGRQKSDRAREVTLSAQDTNYDLRNIIIDGWARPEETDVARVGALLTTYLQGNPRISTHISNTYVSSSNTVTMPARVYDATDPASILGELGAIANKLHFVTVDDDLFYDGNDSTAYLAGIRISDRIGDQNTAGACSSGAPAIEAVNGKVHLGTQDDHLALTVGAQGNTAIYVAITGNHPSATPQAWWHPQGVLTETGKQQLTLIESATNVTGGGRTDLYRLLSPTSGAGDVAIKTTSTFGMVWGYWFISGVDQSTPETTFTNAGQADAASSLTITTDETDLAIDCASWNNADSVPEPTTDPTGSGTEVFAGFWADSPGNSDGQGGLSYGDSTSVWTWDRADRTWTAVGAAVHGAVTGSGSGATTFPPIWDVGPSSTEDGMELLSGLRLYYGQGSNTYVYVNDPSTANLYWNSEKSLYTNDPAINTASRATTLANAILARSKTEDRTYNVSIGPMTEDQVGCIKWGQLLQIKARAIPDADDAFVSRRIAQLRWTTPLPGVYFAHMMLDRPMKDRPNGVGPKTATDSINRHVEQGSNSHPELVQRGVLTTLGDLPYRGASDWTRRAIGSTDQVLTVAGGVPTWAAVPAPSGGVFDLLKTGSADPSSAGVASGTGSIYLRTNGTLWVKFGSGDTDWREVINT